MTYFLVIAVCVFVIVLDYLSSDEKEACLLDKDPSFYDYVSNTCGTYNSDCPNIKPVTDTYKIDLSDVNTTPYKVVYKKAKNGQVYILLHFNSNNKVFMHSETYKNKTFALKKAKELASLLCCELIQE